MKECSPVSQTKPGPQIAVLVFLIVCHVNQLSKIQSSSLRKGFVIHSLQYPGQPGPSWKAMGTEQKTQNFLSTDAAVWGCNTFLVHLEKANTLLLL